jgi:hypothetical protein
MMRCTHLTWLLPLAGAAALCGCRLFEEQAVVQGRSPLLPASPSPDSVAIEMMWVRLPMGDPQFDEAAWQEIDETQIEPAVRSELVAKGFRVGIARGTLPDSMVRAIDKYSSTGSAKASADDSGRAADLQANGSISGTDLLNEPIVRGHRKNLRRNERWEIQASENFPTLTLLQTGGRELSGRNYADAQCVYAVQVDPQPNRTVLLSLTPELHYGPPKLRFTGSEDGIFRSQLRDREVFDRLRMNVRLAAGEMLVLMSLPNSGSQLGEYFHTVDSPQGRQQKLILLRLVQVPPSDTFAAE